VDALLNSSLMLVTALVPQLGYSLAAKIAKMAFEKNLTLRDAALESSALTAAQFDEWVDAKRMLAPGI
jgi:fumarate hydratase class II